MAVRGTNSKQIYILLSIRISIEFHSINPVCSTSINPYVWRLRPEGRPTHTTMPLADLTEYLHKWSVRKGKVPIYFHFHPQPKRFDIGPFKLFANATKQKGSHVTVIWDIICLQNRVTIDKARGHITHADAGHRSWASHATFMPFFFFFFFFFVTIRYNLHCASHFENIIRSGFNETVENTIYIYIWHKLS